MKTDAAVENKKQFFHRSLQTLLGFAQFSQARRL